MGGPPAGLLHCGNPPPKGRCQPPNLVITHRRGSGVKEAARVLPDAIILKIQALVLWGQLVREGSEGRI
jgi:hypothetical protein